MLGKIWTSFIFELSWDDPLSGLFWAFCTLSDAICSRNWPISLLWSSEPDWLLEFWSGSSLDIPTSDNFESLLKEKPTNGRFLPESVALPSFYAFSNQIDNSDLLTNQKQRQNENGPGVVEFLDAHLQSNHHNQSWMYRFLMRFQEFEELIEFYQNSNV